MNFKEKLQAVKCFVFDVDGVLTNGQLLVTHEGELLRSMNIKDGYALQLAIKEGYEVFIISGAFSEGVIKRLNGLGIKDIFPGIPDKKQKLKELLVTKQLSPEEILYMGDDMPDIEVMEFCGVPCCPSDAIQQVKKISIYTSEKKGGEGCVRDIIEQVLILHGKWK